MSDANNAGGTPTVLLVEDDRGDQILMRRCFHYGAMEVDVRFVVDGEEALAYVLRTGQYEDAEESPSPDLILLDINLPGQNGLEVLERMRAEKVRTPIVMLTTSERGSDVDRAMELGANSYITKPTELAENRKLVKLLETYWLDMASQKRPSSG